MEQPVTRVGNTVPDRYRVMLRRQVNCGRRAWSQPTESLGRSCIRTRGTGVKTAQPVATLSQHYVASTQCTHSDTDSQSRGEMHNTQKRSKEKLYSKKPKITTSHLQVFHAFIQVMGGYAIRVNCFLSLTLSLIISIMSPCVPTPFLPLRLWSHAFFRSFPLGLSASLRSVICPVGRRRRPTLLSVCGDPIMDVHYHTNRFGPIEFSHALLFQHFPCRFHE